MKKHAVLACAFLCAALAACSPVRIEKTPYNMTKYEATQILTKDSVKSQSLIGKTVMIVPFSTYVAMSSPLEWLEANVKMYDATSEALQEHGANVVSFEDVFVEMEKRGMISRKLKRFLRKSYLKKNEQTAFIRELNKSLNMRSNEIFDIASKYGADLVIRTQLLAYQEGTNRPLNPLSAGLVTGTLRIGSRILYGRAENEKWRTIQETSIGAIAGAALGAGAKDPFEPPRYEVKSDGHPLLGTSYSKQVGGTSDYDLYNSLVWAGAGAAVGYMAAHGGTNPIIRIQERFLAFDAGTRKLIWSGSSRIKAEPATFLNQDHKSALTSEAMEAASEVLVASFTKTLDYERPKIEVEKVAVKPSDKSCRNNSCFEDYEDLM